MSTRSASLLAYEHKASAGLEQLGPCLRATHRQVGVALAQLDQAAQQACAHDWSYTHFLGYLLDAELVYRHERNVKLNLHFAHLPDRKRLEQFDFSAQPWNSPPEASHSAHCRRHDAADGRALYEQNGLPPLLYVESLRNDPFARLIDKYIPTDSECSPPAVL